MCGAAWCGCLGPRSRARRLCVLRCASVTPHLGAPQGKKLEISPPPLITFDLKRSMGRFRLWMRYYVVSYDIPTMI